mmetsp:Transcript_23190/g.45017  ORF Transcript_23190/g.45017 Transcript_23190/m.45017 type:complete len:240 (+) Transcript_23190:1019-1738(+)
MPRLMHQSRKRSVSRSNSSRIGKRREVSQGGLECPVRLRPRGLRPVAEAVGVLALPVEQIQVHSGTPILNAQLRKAPPPHLDGLLEGEIGVHPLRDVARHHVCHVPRLQRCRSLVVSKPLPRLLHDAPSALLERIQNLKKLLLVEPLCLGHLVVVVIHVPKTLGHLIARLDHLHEPLVKHKGPDGPQTLIHRLTHALVGVCAHPRAESHARHLLEPLPGDLSAKLHGVARSLERPLNGH